MRRRSRALRHIMNPAMALKLRASPPGGSSLLRFMSALMLFQVLVMVMVAWPWNPRGAPACVGPRIFVYDLPPRFNAGLLGNCSSLNPWVSACPALANHGLGQRLHDARLSATSAAWYQTDQFTSEVIFHTRLLRHRCRTHDPAIAAAFYVPFYAGLEIARFLFVPSSPQQRDGLSKQLMEWLQQQAYWRRYGGRDHFLMIGRITWDFRRTADEAWGSSFVYMEGMRNTTRLLIERNPWDDQEMAVPYPTSFHPSSDLDLQRWQQHVGSRKRRVLFAFAGGPRKTIRSDFRVLLLQQCVESGGNCSALNCSAGLCDQPGMLMELFQDAVFCLQPRGDSFTRRSAFDAILAGCIPVFFWNQSAYMQYKWHLPADDSSYSVFIPKDAVRNGVSIKQVLMALPAERVARMRRTIIGLIPSIIYASPDHQSRKWKDAFDIAIDGVLSRIQSLELDPRPHSVVSTQAADSVDTIAK